MPQTNTLTSGVKQKAPVIVLNPRNHDSRTDAERQLRIFRLSDMLSRDLDIKHIMSRFSDDIQQEIPHCGYRYESRELGLTLESGAARKHRASYRLDVSQRELGEICLFRNSQFGEEELAALEELLCTLIYPLKNSLMYQLALNSAYSDPLTGLNNRVAMEKSLPREVELSIRHDHDMAILVMDLDGFKDINDRLGHDVGDQVLCEVGQVLRSAIRNTDLMYRYGGDEFVGGLPQTDINGALEVSERIRKGVETMTVSGQELHRAVEMSIGITMLRRGDSFHQAFKRADKALYQAKRGGKNRIIII